MLAMCKQASFYTRFDISSRSSKATAKVQGALYDLSSSKAIW